MKKIKIIVSDTAPLYPPSWGGPKRIWGLYNNLTKEFFDIDYIGISKQQFGEKIYEVNKIEENFREFLFTLPFRAKFWNFFEKKAFSELRLPLFTYIWMHKSKEFCSAFKWLKADIVISSHPWAGKCVEKSDHFLFIYDAHNCEYYLIQQLIDNNWIHKWLAKRIKSVEKEVCEKSDLILVTSEFDKEQFLKVYGIDEKKLVIIPNGTDVNKIPSIEERMYARKLLNLPVSKKIILFVGSYYNPNIEAARFITKMIAPHFQKYNFLIAGTVAYNCWEDDLPSNVKLVPQCDNREMDYIFKASDLALNPIVRGGGTNIKVLDYMGYGIPTISTPYGCRGFNFTPNVEIYVCPLKEFSEAIEKILSTEALSQRLSLKGWEAVARNYGWKSISRKLEQILLERLGRQNEKFT